MLSKELQCQQCQWWTLCGSSEMARRLRTLGLLRRAPDPPDDLVAELLLSYGPKLKCDRCQAVGLAISDPAGEDRGDWQQARTCEVCRTPIDLERLAVLPDATRCAACQSSADRGETPVEVDYCPKCGAPMELRTSKAGGLSRYRLFCTAQPPCRV